MPSKIVLPFSGYSYLNSNIPYFDIKFTCWSFDRAYSPFYNPALGSVNSKSLIKNSFP